MKTKAVSTHTHSQPMTHGRPLSRPPALGSSPSEGAAAAPGHCGDSRRNDYANPRSPLPLSRGWQLMLRDACGLIATPLPGWPAATPPSRAIAASQPTATRTAHARALSPSRARERARPRKQIMHACMSDLISPGYYTIPPLS